MQAQSSLHTTSSDAPPPLLFADPPIMHPGVNNHALPRPQFIGQRHSLCYSMISRDKQAICGPMTLQLHLHHSQYHLERQRYFYYLVDREQITAF